MKAALHRTIDYLQMKFPPNRIAVLLTPLVFVPVAGAVSAWLAENFPGVTFSSDVVVGFAAAGALSALTTAYKWIDGWQSDEAAFNHYWNAEKKNLPAK
jgi:hypothetical protein